VNKLSAAVLGVSLALTTAAHTLPAQASTPQPAPSASTRTFNVLDEPHLGEGAGHDEHAHDEVTTMTLPVKREATLLGSQATGAAQAVRKVKVVMLVPSDVSQDPQPMTETQVRTAVASASKFWGEQSSGAVRFEVSSFRDWTKSPHSCSDMGSIWDDAAKAGLKPGTDETILAVFPKSGFSAGKCSYGLATIGDSLNAPGYASVTGASTALVAHELGHNLGAGHADAVSCLDGATTKDPTSSNPWACANGHAHYEGYGDVVDVMGPSGDIPGSLNSSLADQLGFSSAGFRDVSTNGTFDLASLPVANDGRVHSLRVRDPFSRVTYYVEHRGASSNDKHGGQFGSTLGVRVLRDGPGGPGSVLVDATPTSGPDGSPVLPQGSVFSTSSGQVHFTPTRVAADGASVKVTFGAAPVPLAPAPAPAPPAPVHSDSTSFYGPNGTVDLYGPVLARYRELGMFQSVLQAPSSRTQPLANGGSFSHFQGGSIYHSPATGAWVVRGAIRDRWAALGWENGLGYPTTDEFPIKDGVLQRFERGLVYWSPATGAREVKGAILSTYGSVGWENGLGYPTTGEVPVRGGAFNHFQRGSVYWSPATGAQVVKGAILDKWGRTGWESGFLGYPVAGEFGPLRAGGYGQHFQGGSVYWSPATGVASVRGALRDAYGARGWENGLGYPRGDEYGVNGGVRQDFQNGSLTYWWSTRTVTPS
jgi:hypothetical protein